MYLKEEFCNITIFLNHETGRFVATKLHTNSSYEVCGNSQKTLVLKQQLGPVKA